MHQKRSGWQNAAQAAALGLSNEALFKAAIQQPVMSQIQADIEKVKATFLLLTPGQRLTVLLSMATLANRVVCQALGADLASGERSEAAAAASPREAHPVGNTGITTNRPVNQ